MGVPVDDRLRRREETEKRCLCWLSVCSRSHVLTLNLPEEVFHSSWLRDARYRVSRPIHLTYYQATASRAGRIKLEPFQTHTQAGRTDLRTYKAQHPRNRPSGRLLKDRLLLLCISVAPLVINQYTYLVSDIF